MPNQAANRTLKISILRFNPHEPGACRTCRPSRSKKRKI